MSDVALYRKYRPAKFSEVIGQDHVTSVLEGALESGQTAHAYLFAGPRGTGKTSVARILARALGCSVNDLYEIDAASSRGVDDIRELREAVRTLPFESPVKVYIIDEVHMLTREAFNALLKTLEEPPSHVVFILATTELHKVPETIISRCQVFSFKRPNSESLTKVIGSIAKKEGFAIDKEAANLIALLGDGAFRDAIGTLQKVMASSADKKISAAEVEAATGAPNSWLIYNFILSILNRDLAGGLGVVHQAVENNRDMKAFLKLALREIRLAMLLKFAPAMSVDVLADLGEEETKFITDIKDRPEAKELPNILRELLASYDTLSNFYLPELALELALVKLIGE
jgi:DNA polymerase-3 subunit gamma/tau